MRRFRIQHAFDSILTVKKDTQQIRELKVDDNEEGSEFREGCISLMKHLRPQVVHEKRCVIK